MEAQLFDRIQPRTLRAEIVDVLRDAIVSGKLESGEHLKESVIAEQMSVSRIPVREAFQQLEQEGLIVSIPNQGSFVKVFDEKDIREIFTLRGALERFSPCAARWRAWRVNWFSATIYCSRRTWSTWKDTSTSRGRPSTRGTLTV
jgi:DNA-binding GntR family transcriptional regulator